MLFLSLNIGFNWLGLYRLSPGLVSPRLESEGTSEAPISLHTGPFGVLLKGHVGYAGKPQELGLTS